MLRLCRLGNRINSARCPVVRHLLLKFTPSHSSSAFYIINYCMSPAFHERLLWRIVIAQICSTFPFRKLIWVKCQELTNYNWYIATWRCSGVCRACIRVRLNFPDNISKCVCCISDSPGGLKTQVVATRTQWRRGCLCACHVDVLCLNDWVYHYATFTRL